MSSQVKLRVGLYARYDKWEKSGVDWYALVRVGDDPMYPTAGLYDAPLYAEVEVEVPNPPQSVLINAEVERLRDMQQRARAEVTRKCTEIDEQIQNLLALTYEGGSRG